jgi:SAM-dependent methyltransferase
MAKEAAQFKFGENWASYSALIEAPQIKEAEAGLLKLIPADELRGASFLDIGCGSGLHSLAAARLGATVTAIDRDSDCIRTTDALLGKHGVAGRTLCVSVFDAGPLGAFDIVYSWGVLHHTGAMWPALERAASYVRPGGLLAVALYRATRLDGFWTLEKRLYSQAPRPIQAVARAGYRGLYRMANVLRGRDHRAFLKNYRTSRGMDFDHDVHDWLGGYPYETASAPDVAATMEQLGFSPERAFVQPKPIGVMGSGCDEYVYRRKS